MVRVIWSIAKRNEAYQVRGEGGKIESDEACVAISA